MNGELIRTYGREVLGLTLSDDEADALVGAVAGLRNLVAEIERVPLPYAEEPFTSPRMSDLWLARWSSR